MLVAQRMKFMQKRWYYLLTQDYIKTAIVITVKR